MANLSRRNFLKASGSSCFLALTNLTFKSDIVLANASGISNIDVPAIDYKGFEAVYREKWQWDSVAKGTHFVNCWYQRGCNWNVYVKDGIVWREEQAATYEPIDEKIPDYNPRGCQKGACYSERMYDDSRLHYPLKRVGERGEGKWKRLSWDEALTEVADKTIDSMIGEHGPGSVVWDPGTANNSGGFGLGVFRCSAILDTPMTEAGTEIGDHRPGASVTMGKIAFCSSSDDVFHSDLILIWGGNPFFTQIPNVHFLTEARYNGAKLVSILPDYNASAIHADLWVPVAVGSDAAFGLSMAQVMIEEDIYKKAFVKEQTDLPLLVRLDNGRFLRQEDLKEGGSSKTFYIYDQVSQQIVESKQDTLMLGEQNPALEGEFEVETLQGVIRVRPTFAKLKEHVQQYVPEEATKICGTHPDMIRQLARDLCRAKAATCLAQSNFGKYYHGIEMERAQILVMSLAGQIGRKGAGYMGFPYMAPDGNEMLQGDADGVKIMGVDLPPKIALIAAGAGIPSMQLKSDIENESNEQFIYRMASEHYKHKGAQATSVWNYFQGMDESYGRSGDWDPHMKRSFDAYMNEAIDKGWQFKPDAPAKVLFACGSNPLRRVRANDLMYEKIVSKLDMMVSVDWRMSTTGLYSDYVFPAAAWYEKDDITWSTPLSPYAQVVTRAAEPVAEAKADWEFHCLLMKKIQQRAKERGLTTFKDRHDHQRSWNVYDSFTWGGRFHEDNIEELLDLMLKISTNTDQSWADLKEKGSARFTGIGTNGFMGIGNATDVTENETISCNTWHVEKKQPWPTTTRRIQFHIDHPLYEELGEVLPVHKDSPPMGGGQYPLTLTSGHTRWSIHAAWIDQKDMMQLNRDMPWIMINNDDAAERGIADGDTVRLRNDVGECEMQARVAGTVRPGQVIAYHAWEPYQYKNRKSFKALTPSPFNPIELAGGDHLQARLGVNSPSSSDRGTRVEIVKVAG